MCCLCMRTWLAIAFPGNPFRISFKKSNGEQDNDKSYGEDTDHVESSLELAKEAQEEGEEDETDAVSDLYAIARTSPPGK